MPRKGAVEAYSGLLRGSDPAKAAEIVAEHMGWRWAPDSYNPEAPALLRSRADDLAWRRFEADKPIAEKEVAAHCLFRAATYQQGYAREVLCELGRSLFSEIVNAWLSERAGGNV